jgi:hypothetical protein
MHAVLATHTKNSIIYVYIANFYKFCIYLHIVEIVMRVNLLYLSDKFTYRVKYIGKS